MVGLDLLRQRPEVAVLDAELVVAGAPLGVVLPRRLVAERFELLESFIERHGRDSPKRVSGRPRPGCRTTRRTSRRVPRASTAAARESRTAANTPQSTEINRTAHPTYPFGSEPDLRKGERVSGRGRKVDVSRQSKRRGGVCSDPHRGLVHSTWGGGHAGTEAGNAALVGTGFCSDVYDWGEGRALQHVPGGAGPETVPRPGRTRPGGPQFRGEPGGPRRRCPVARGLRPDLRVSGESAGCFPSRTARC